jgi:hypothetical protein
VLTEEGVKAKNRPKNAQKLRRIGFGVQNLTFFNRRQSGEIAS